MFSSGAPKTTSSPIGNFPELWAYMDAIKGGNYSSANAGVEENKNAITLKNNEIGRQKRMAELKSIIESQDPSKYQKKPKDDGGWDYFDGTGKPISYIDFAKAKGINYTDALNGSTNPRDVQFQSDYDSFKKMLSDKKYFEKIQKENPQLASRTPQQFVDAFKKVYPEYYETDNRLVPAIKRIGSGVSGAIGNWLGY